MGYVFLALCFDLAFGFMNMSTRYNEFGVDGGLAVKELVPKFTIVEKHLSSKLGIGSPDIDVRHVVATAIALKGIGGFLFVFGSSFGAYPLLLYLAFTTPLLYNFCNSRRRLPKQRQFRYVKEAVVEDWNCYWRC